MNRLLIGLLILPFLGSASFAKPAHHSAHVVSIPKKAAAASADYTISKPAGATLTDSLGNTIVLSASGTQMAVNSPARNSAASVVAARRSVLMCPPGRTGTIEGATTWQS